MKSLFGTFVFVGAAVVAVVAVLSFRALAQPTGSTGKKFTLNIGRTAEDYAELKDKTAFDTALKALRNHGGQFTIRFKPERGNVIENYQPVSIKTDKVTTSEVAQRDAAEESAVGDPNVVNHLSADYATDITGVLDTFK
jgi:hypothetical protein